MDDSKGPLSIQFSITKEGRLLFGCMMVVLYEL